jgi:hypothetical protein
MASYRAKDETICPSYVRRGLVVNNVRSSQSGEPTLPFRRIALVALQLPVFTNDCCIHVSHSLCSQQNLKQPLHNCGHWTRRGPKEPIIEPPSRSKPSLAIYVLCRHRLYKEAQRADLIIDSRPLRLIRYGHTGIVSRCLLSC